MRLDEFTEVVVSPKTRHFPPSKDLQQNSVASTSNIAQGSNEVGEMSDSRQEPSITSASPDPSVTDVNSQLSASASSIVASDEQVKGVDHGLMSRLSGYLQNLFYGFGDESCGGENLTSFTQKDVPSREENSRTSMSSLDSTPKLGNNVLKETGFQMCLRVQPELTTNDIKSNNTHPSKSTCMKYYSLQPSAVFVDFASLPPLVLKSWTCNLESFPPSDGTMVKTVQIRKLLSPTERAALLSNSTTTNNRENVVSRTQDSTSNSDAEDTNSSSQGKQSLVSWNTARGRTPI